jgi:hypothetical protein
LSGGKREEEDDDDEKIWELVWGGASKRSER